MPWAPDYLGLEPAKHYLGIDHDNDDDELLTAISLVSRAIDKHCNRQFGRVDESTEFLYTAWYDSNTGTWRVPIDDLMDADDLAVTVRGTTVSSAGYKLRPANNVAQGKPWTVLVFTSDAEARPTGREDEVSATSPNWGWLPGIPPAIVHVSKMQLNRVHWRRDAPQGTAGSPSLAGEIRLLAKLDPDGQLGLKSYLRPRRPG